MYAGRLDRRVTLRGVTESVNDFGEKIRGFSDLVTLYADIREQSGREIVTNGVENAQKNVIFKIRYRAGVTTDMKIRYGDDDYDIEAINEIQRRKGLELVCKRLRA